MRLLFATLLIIAAALACSDIKASDGTKYDLKKLSGIEFEANGAEPFVYKFVVCGTIGFECGFSEACSNPNRGSVCQSFGTDPWDSSNRDSQTCCGVYSGSASDVIGLNNGKGVIIFYNEGDFGQRTEINITCDKKAGDLDQVEIEHTSLYKIYFKSKHACPPSPPLTGREILLLVIFSLVAVALIAVIFAVIWYTTKIDKRVLYGEASPLVRDEHKEITTAEVLENYKPTPGGPISNRPIQVKKIYKFLQKIEMQEYCDNFLKNGYEQMDIVKVLSDNDLRAIGISKAGHRKKILVGIRRLK